MSQRLEAFADLLPKLPAKRALVLETILSQGEVGATLADLVRLTGWQMHRLSGRVTELRDAGLLREAGTRGRQTIWVACLPQAGVPKTVKTRAVKGEVRGISTILYFGGMTDITVRVPLSAVSDLELGSSITLKV